MSKEYKTIEIIKKTTKVDVSNMYATTESVGIDSPFNNNIHFHSFFELEFIISGSGKYEINNTPHEIKTGALFLTTPADFHTYSLKEDEHIEYYNVQFFPEQIGEEISSYLYSRSRPIAILYDGDKYRKMSQLFDEIISVFEEKPPMYEVILRNCIENLCIYIINDFGSDGDDGECSAIKNAIIYIKDNYRSRITLSDAASRAGISNAYFSHLFSTVTGMRFSSYVRIVRLNAAANLLKSTDLTIKEISYNTGFSNPIYFANTFTSQFGMSPRDYRENYLSVKSKAPANQ